MVNFSLKPRIGVDSDLKEHGLYGLCIEENTFQPSVYIGMETKAGLKNLGWEHKFVTAVDNGYLRNMNAASKILGMPDNELDDAMRLPFWEAAIVYDIGRFVFMDKKAIREFAVIQDVYGVRKPLDGLVIPVKQADGRRFYTQANFPFTDSQMGYATREEREGLVKILHDAKILR